MSSARKRAYQHKAYAEIDRLKQKLMLVEHHYSVMKGLNNAVASAHDALAEENKELRDLLSRVKEQCLFTDDDGQIGVSSEAQIDSYLFDEIVLAITKE